jgi:RNA polymerase sigma-70 factor, ECF subfamily
MIMALSATPPGPGAPDAARDHHLVAALIAGAPGAATLAWKTLSPLVLRVLRRYSGLDPDRQDLCQEVFLRLFTRIGELRNHGALHAFVVNICLGVAQNELRRRRLRRIVGWTSADEIPDCTLITAKLEAREATVRFYQILAGIDPEDRALFVIRYIEKMELAEIVAIKGWSLSTTKRRLARLSRRITARMKRDPALSEYAERVVSSLVRKRSQGRELTKFFPMEGIEASSYGRRNRF